MKIQEFIDQVGCNFIEVWKHQWTVFYNFSVMELGKSGEEVSDTTEPSATAIFDKTGEIKCIIAYDYTRKTKYRWFSEDVHEAYREECKSRGIDYLTDGDDKSDENYLTIVDCDVLDDIMEKAIAIVNGKNYDTRVVMNLDLPDDLLMELFKTAHEKDITFNKLMEEILTRASNEVLENNASEGKMKLEKSNDL